jgi:spermidine synthase
VSFFVGLVILAFELTAARVVAPYLGTTVYIWTSIIGVILAALAVGYAVGGKLADDRKQANDIVHLLSISAAGILLVNVFKDVLLENMSTSGLPLQLQALLSSLVLFAIPTFFLGMISPYLARLSITELKTSGAKLANISAAGTVGSLTGTFLTGYVLFGFFGTKNLMAIFAISLIVIGFMINRGSLLIRFLIIVLGLSQIYFSPNVKLIGFIAEQDTAYSRVIIREVTYNNEKIRVLQTDNMGLQSGMYVDGRKDLVLDYARGMNYATELIDPPKKILVIGGGAFSLPIHFANKYPESQVETVEIDEQLITISKQYFNFEYQPNHSVVSADGRQFINDATGRYDLIILDAYNSIVPPFQLLTTEAVQHMARLLNPNGMIAANFIAATEGKDSSLIKSAASTFGDSFDQQMIFRVSTRLTPDRRQNVLLLASRQPFNQERIDTLRTEHQDFASMLETQVVYEPEQSRILRDDFAPVERLSL